MVGVPAAGSDNLLDDGGSVVMSSAGDGRSALRRGPADLDRVDHAFIEHASPVIGCLQDYRHCDHHPKVQQHKKITNTQ